MTATDRQCAGMDTCKEEKPTKRKLQLLQNYVLFLLSRLTTGNRRRQTYRNSSHRFNPAGCGTLPCGIIVRPWRGRLAARWFTICPQPALQYFSISATVLRDTEEHMEFNTQPAALLELSTYL